MLSTLISASRDLNSVPINRDQVRRAEAEMKKSGDFGALSQRLTNLINNPHLNQQQRVNLIRNIDAVALALPLIPQADQRVVADVSTNIRELRNLLKEGCQFAKPTSADAKETQANGNYRTAVTAESSFSARSCWIKARQANVNLLRPDGTK